MLQLFGKSPGVVFEIPGLQLAQYRARGKAEWHPPLRELLPNIELTILAGQYSQRHYLGKTRKKTLTETVTAWRDYLPAFLRTPHPSWRTTGWQKRNPWFETELLPVLRERVHALL